MPWISEEEYNKQFSEVKLAYNSKDDVQKYIEGLYKGAFHRNNVFGKSFPIHKVLCTVTKTIYLIVEKEEKSLFRFVEMNQQVRVKPTWYSFDIEVFV